MIENKFTPQNNLISRVGLISNLINNGKHRPNNIVLYGKNKNQL